MGNPHAIFWVDDPDARDLAAIGPRLEHDPMFPDRANISLARMSQRATTSACASGSAGSA